MSDNPCTNLNVILAAAFKEAGGDEFKQEMVDLAYAELQSVLHAVKANREAHEASSKALYHLQFVQHEELLDKYCALRDAMKNLVIGLGYNVTAA